jgi:hypothetical protein
MKKLFTTFLIMLSLSIYSQDYSEQAKNHFSKYLDSKLFIELCSKSFPTIEECKLVFKGQNAYTYFGYIEDIKSKMAEELKKDSEKFLDIRIEAFCTSDIIQDKGNYAGGMKSMSDKLQNYVTFYEINLLRTMEAEFGVAYKYWVNINGRWVFFPKPWNAFSK